MPKQYNWAGARWWKFDFHTHTPVSEDYGKGPNQAELKKRTPKEWLLDYMKAGIDCVAITDHNSGEWIDKLKKTDSELKTENHPDYRPLYLFPGVEISVHGGVHFLAILPEDKTTSDIDTLLGAAEYRGDKGKTCNCTEESPLKVIEEIVKAGGLAIPAHVDEASGIFEALHGTTLEQILKSSSIIAMEIYDSSFTKPDLYRSNNLEWPEILGSDAHHPTGSKSPGSHYTWIKMGEPNIHGLRLALLDGALSIKRSDMTAENPNEKYGDLIIENFCLEKAKYIGKDKSFVCEFNPWLNTIIGGRGTGKSTILELLRQTFRREKELEALPENLKDDFKKYRTAYENRDAEGLLTEDTVLVATYRKDDSRYRVQWNYNGDLSPIESEDSEGNWQESTGDITQRFPVRIYSQKQIFELAKNTQALLQIVDDAPQVGYGKWRDERDALQRRYLSLEAQIREMKTGIKDESRLKGQLEDVIRQLSVFEKSGHAEIFKAYQVGQRQLRIVENWEKSWIDAPQKIRELKEIIQPDNFDKSVFMNESAEDTEWLKQIEVVSREIQKINDKLDSVVNNHEENNKNWVKIKQNSKWLKSVHETIRHYQKLQESLTDAGIEDPSVYGRLVQQKQTLEEQLKNFDSKRKTLEELGKQAEEILDKIIDHRKNITSKRSEFLEKLLTGNTYVSIDVIPYGNQETIEMEFRKMISREGEGLKSDIGTVSESGTILGNLYSGFSFDKLPTKEQISTFESRLKELKQDILEIKSGVEKNGYGGWFIKHIQTLSPEQLDRFNCWHPEDSLRVLYSVEQSGKKIPVKQGSPGQKTAALLAFLLSYGNEPLILDQPEDDLDNHLIYDLIVTQLKAIKNKRQIIIVTHNANIVVNGDAENVIALDIKNGQTHAVCKGSLQEPSVREEICKVMEGGPKAFDLRYKRIREGGASV